MEVPQFLRQNYDIREWRNAIAILKANFPQEWHDIVTVLSNFRLRREDIMQGGGNKSSIATRIDTALRKLGWEPRRFDTRIIVKHYRTSNKSTQPLQIHEYASPTHEVDMYKNGVAIEVE